MALASKTEKPSAVSRVGVLMRSALGSLTSTVSPANAATARIYASKRRSSEHRSSVKIGHDPALQRDSVFTHALGLSWRCVESSNGHFYGKWEGEERDARK